MQKYFFLKFIIFDKKYKYNYFSKEVFEKRNIKNNKFKEN